MEPEKAIGGGTHAAMLPTVLFQKVGERAAILKLDTETYYELDETATEMWELLEAGASLSEAVERLAAEFDAPAERIRADLVRLVGNLRDEGLVRID